MRARLRQAITYLPPTTCDLRSIGHKLSSVLRVYFSIVNVIRAFCHFLLHCRAACFLPKGFIEESPLLSIKARSQPCCPQSTSCALATCFSPAQFQHVTLHNNSPPPAPRKHPPPNPRPTRLQRPPRPLRPPILQHHANRHARLGLHRRPPARQPRPAPNHATQRRHPLPPSPNARQPVRHPKPLPHILLPPRRREPHIVPLHREDLARRQPLRSADPPPHQRRQPPPLLLRRRLHRQQPQTLRLPPRLQPRPPPPDRLAHPSRPHHSQYAPGLLPRLRRLPLNIPLHPRRIRLLLRNALRHDGPGLRRMHARPPPQRQPRRPHVYHQPLPGRFDPGGRGPRQRGGRDDERGDGGWERRGAGGPVCGHVWAGAEGGVGGFLGEGERVGGAG